MVSSAALEPFKCTIFGYMRTILNGPAGAGADVLVDLVANK
jgi:hypothetical protein